MSAKVYVIHSREKKYQMDLNTSMDKRDVLYAVFSWPYPDFAVPAAVHFWEQNQEVKNDG